MIGETTRGGAGRGEALLTMAFSPVHGRRRAAFRFALAVGLACALPMPASAQRLPAAGSQGAASEAASLEALAQAYREAGDRGSAISLFRQAIARDPQREEAYAAMAEVYVSLAQMGAAAEAVKAGLRRRPRSLRLWLVMIDVLERQGREHDALEAARHLTRLHPAAPSALRLHASLAISAGRYVEALAVCRRLFHVTGPSGAEEATSHEWARERVPALRLLSGTLDAARASPSSGASVVRRALSSAPISP